ncbi:MAG: hypothetical protein Q4C65_02525 [Eubacteriales bacterium]|nr:hypothetical protein [Eubacteriales bacterium]
MIKLSQAMEEKRCGDVCPGTECKHTSDINHAKNFVNSEYGYYWERSIWRPISEYSREKYDWVLIKYFAGDYECIPTVAEMRTDGKWYTHGILNDEMIPFEVRYFADLPLLEILNSSHNGKKQIWNSGRRSRKMNRGRFIQGLKSDIQLSEKERRRIVQSSLQKYHWKTKCTVAMEEFAELQQQISKQIRGYGDRIGLLEEMADAYICLNFLESIFDIKSEDLQKAVDVKLERERRNLQ